MYCHGNQWILTDEDDVGGHGLFPCPPGLEYTYSREPVSITNEPSHEKTNNLGFRPGPTQTGLCSHGSMLETGNFGFRK